MTAIQITSYKQADSYYSIFDSGDDVERLLVITDDNGNVATLKNEQIGELYRQIKPPLAG